MLHIANRNTDAQHDIDCLV